MEDIITPSNVMFVISLVSVLFAVFLYFKNPQTSLEQKQALLDQEVDNKADLLAKVYEIEKKATEGRFTEFNNRLIEANGVATNHIHSIDVKVDGLIAQISSMNQSITRLETIIEERVPKK